MSGSPRRGTPSCSTNPGPRRARGGVTALLRRAIVSLPLILALVVFGLLFDRNGETAFFSALVLLLLWIAAAIHASVRPHRGWHDRLARTWVVCR